MKCASSRVAAGRMWNNDDHAIARMQYERFSKAKEQAGKKIRIKTVEDISILA